jgi:hypothetical protein
MAAGRVTPSAWGLPSACGGMEELENRVLMSAAARTTSGNWLDVPVPSLESPHISFIPEIVINHKVFFEGDDQGIVAVYDAQTRSFSTKILPEYQTSATPAVIGEKVILAGGFGGWASFRSLPSKRVNIFDMHNGQWSTANLSVARGGMKTLVTGDKLILAGGNVNSPGAMTNDSNAVDIYDASTNQWSATAVPRGHKLFSMFPIGQRIYFVGGNDAGLGILTPTARAVDVYDLSTGQWTSITPAHVPIGTISATLGHQHFFAGGYYFNRHGVYTASDIVDIYDDSTDQWSSARLSLGRFDPTVAAVGGKVIFAGGYASKGHGNPVALGTVDMYDAVTGKWSTTTLAQPRAFGGVETVGNVALLYGGEQNLNASTGSSLVDVYDARADRWSTATLSHAARGVVAAPVGGRVFFVGGGLTAVDDAQYNVDVFDSKTGRWSRSISALGYDGGGGYGHGTAFVVDDQIIINSPAGNWHTLISTTIPAPTGQSPAQGGALAEPPKSLTWSAVPGATSYDLLIDGVAVRHLYRNRWTPSGPITAGSHRWRVFAHVDGGVLSGPSASFTVAGADLRGRIENVYSPTSFQSVDKQSTATIEVQVSNVDPNALPITAKIYASLVRTVGVGAFLMGSATVPSDWHGRGGSIQLKMPLRFPDGRAFYGQYYMILVLSTPRATVQVAARKGRWG